MVQPNKDGNYWRKIVQNKMVRTKDAWMVTVAKLWAMDLLEMEDKWDAHVVSRGDCT